MSNVIQVTPTIQGPDGLFYSGINAWECKGPNVNCRQAHREGRSWHVTPPQFPSGVHVVLPTYHYATLELGVEAVNQALRNAPTITNDEDLARYRKMRISYCVPQGFIDPSRR
ncbi:hypothetical protein FND50_12660 [Rhodococcus sp. WB9]|uniref:hypothetical protein n=1 Tax=Rhodococcus sp. WB9 TaxID=2594007 RepID=UPI001185FFB5|nr:hypothetical protein [Rhodococcus sp. WB9]QDQ91585.1 hypothetical protein FND50_12660 [Rhodococcus sp. WB9]